MSSSAWRNVPVDITLDSNHTDVNLLGGFSIKESDGTPAVATVNLRKGVENEDNTGDLLMTIELAANESTLVEFVWPIPGDPTYGVFVEDVAGTTSGVLFKRTQ